jgi:hypothetical protein
MEAVRLHYKPQDGETIQYVNVMSLYRYLWNYFISPSAIQQFMWETQGKGSLLANGWPYKMFYRSTREVVSRAHLPSQSETHVLSGEIAS